MSVERTGSTGYTQNKENIVPAQQKESAPITFSRKVTIGETQKTGAAKAGSLAQQKIKAFEELAQKAAVFTEKKVVVSPQSGKVPETAKQIKSTIAKKLPSTTTASKPQPQAPIVAKKSASTQLPTSKVVQEGPTVKSQPATIKPAKIEQRSSSQIEQPDEKAVAIDQEAHEIMDKEKDAKDWATEEKDIKSGSSLFSVSAGAINALNLRRARFEKKVDTCTKFLTEHPNHSKSKQIQEYRDDAQKKLSAAKKEFDRNLPKLKF